MARDSAGEAQASPRAPRSCAQERLPAKAELWRGEKPRKSCRLGSAPWRSR